MSAPASASTQGAALQALADEAQADGEYGGDVPTWYERCEVHPDHQEGMVTNRMIKERMQEEIDALRADRDKYLRRITILECQVKHFKVCTPLPKASHDR